MGNLCSCLKSEENAEQDVPHGLEVDQKGQEELNSHDTNNETAEANNAGEDSVDENSLFVECCGECCGNCLVEFVISLLSQHHSC